MPSILRRNAISRLPDGVCTREAFYVQVDRMLEGSFDASMGIAYARLSNVGVYSRLVGVQAGDDVVASFVESITGQLGRGALVSNEGGSTAIFLVARDKVEGVAAEVTHRLVTSFDAPNITLGVGWCPLSTNYDARGALERARFAYRSRGSHDTGRVFFFTKELGHTFDRRRYIVDHLDDAIENGEIRAFAQPVVRIVTGRVCEVEILARWTSERFGNIYPDEFIPLLEQFRLVHKLDAAIVNLACRQWREAQDLDIAVPFGINLSRLDFELCDIYQVVREAMRLYGVPIDMVHVEVTESAATGDVDLLRAGVKRFNDAGFKVYMDDYGTGFSSLEGLLGRYYNVVKLDKSLIDNLETDERSRVLVADAVSMIKRLGMQTLCEGIESLEQLIFLKMIGCEKGQGYFFGRPVDHKSIMASLTQEANHYEETRYDTYLDAIGRVNLVDGSYADAQGVEAAVFSDDKPVAVVESVDGHIYLLESNVAFDEFMRQIGVSSYEDLIEKISAGEGLTRKRFGLAAARARKTGEQQSVDFISGGFFSTVSITHVASTDLRDAYLIKASSVGRSFSIEREHSMELASPFLFSIYKRIDLFDLESGTSTNLYLSAPLLRNSRMQGTILTETREFRDKNIHPADRERFTDFYDLSTLGKRVEQSGGHHVATILRTREPDGGYVDHIYTLIPMTVAGKHQVLSTLRAIDVGTNNSFQVSGDARISDAMLLKAVLEGTDRYVFWKDDQRRFLGANQAFLDYYGFSSIDEILGKTDDEVGWHTDNKPFRDDELRVLAGETVLRARGTCYDRNELRVIEANKRPIVVAGRVVGLLGYFRDLGPAEDERRPEY